MQILKHNNKVYEVKTMCLTESQAHHYHKKFTVGKAYRGQNELVEGELASLSTSAHHLSALIYHLVDKA